MYMIMYLYLIMYLNMYMYMYMYLNMITVVYIKSMRPAHERVNAPPFFGKISNRHFFKKNFNFALDISAGWDYIITIPTGYLISSYRENELLI